MRTPPRRWLTPSSYSAPFIVALIVAMSLTLSSFARASNVVNQRTFTTDAITAYAPNPGTYAFDNATVSSMNLPNGERHTMFNLQNRVLVQTADGQGSQSLFLDGDPNAHGYRQKQGARLLLVRFAPSAGADEFGVIGVRTIPGQTCNPSHGYCPFAAVEFFAVSEGFKSSSAPNVVVPPGAPIAVFDNITLAPFEAREIFGFLGELTVDTTTSPPKPGHVVAYSAMDARQLWHYVITATPDRVIDISLAGTKSPTAGVTAGYGNLAVAVDDFGDSQLHRIAFNTEFVDLDTMQVGGSLLDYSNSASFALPGGGQTSLDLTGNMHTPNSLLVGPDSHGTVRLWAHMHLSSWLISGRVNVDATGNISLDQLRAAQTSGQVFTIALGEVGGSTVVLAGDAIYDAVTLDKRYGLNHAISGTPASIPAPSAWLVNDPSTPGDRFFERYFAFAPYKTATGNFIAQEAPFPLQHPSSGIKFYQLFAGNGPGHTFPAYGIPRYTGDAIDVDYASGVVHNDLITIADQQTAHQLRHVADQGFHANPNGLSAEEVMVLWQYSQKGYSVRGDGNAAWVRAELAELAPPTLSVVAADNSPRHPGLIQEWTVTTDVPNGTTLEAAFYLSDAKGNPGVALKGEGFGAGYVEASSLVVQGGQATVRWLVTHPDQGASGPTLVTVLVSDPNSQASATAALPLSVLPPRETYEIVQPPGVDSASRELLVTNLDGPGHLLVIAGTESARMPATVLSGPNGDSWVTLGQIDAQGSFGLGAATIIYDGSIDEEVVLDLPAAPEMIYLQAYLIRPQPSADQVSSSPLLAVPTMSADVGGIWADDDSASEPYGSCSMTKSSPHSFGASAWLFALLGTSFLMWRRRSSRITRNGT